MRSHQDKKSDDNVEDSILGFFELFFITSRDEHKPTSIDHEDNTENREKCIEVGEDFCNDCYSSREVLIFDSTLDRQKPSSRCTIRSPVEGTHECLGNLDEEKSNERIDNRIFSFFEFFLISASRYDNIKCIEHHDDKGKSRKHLKEVNNRRKYTRPKCISECPPHRVYATPEKESIPNGERNLHDKHTDRNPDNIASPLCDIFITCLRKKKFQNPKNEKEESNCDKEIFDLKGDNSECTSDSFSSYNRCCEEKFTKRGNKGIKIFVANIC